MAKKSDKRADDTRPDAVEALRWRATWLVVIRSDSKTRAKTRGGTPEQHAAAGRQSHKNQ